MVPGEESGEKNGDIPDLPASPAKGDVPLADGVSSSRDA
jgi:hypothetical protein